LEKRRDADREEERAEEDVEKPVRHNPDDALGRPTGPETTTASLRWDHPERMNHRTDPILTIAR
jgi:hypothetical protein